MSSRATAVRSNVALRELRPDDGALLCRIYASTRLEELAPLGWSDEQIDAFLRMQYEAQRQDYWSNYDTSRFNVITCDGVDAGRLYVERRDKELSIIDIALLPEFRNLGIGELLITQLFDEADANDLAVRIHVEHENRAQHFYLRLGFAFCGEAGPIYRLMERLPRAPHAVQAA
jgi:ribosomal protein S18 acetylase RimI-like enzyme